MILVLTLLFFFAVLFLQGWVAVVLALCIAPYRFGTAIIVAGGALFDALYGAPIAAIGGFSHVYLVVFCIVAVGAYVLNDFIIA